MAYEIKIDGFEAIVPNEIYSRERIDTKEEQTIDPNTKQSGIESVEKYSTDLLMLSIASLPSRQETLERIAEESKGIVADVASGKLAASDSYKRLTMNMDSGYSPAQQILLCMPYTVVETLANAVIKPELAKGLIDAAEKSYPLSERYGKPVENDNDLDLINIVFMPWDKSALDKSVGDKSDANSYWGLLQPKMIFQTLTFLMQDGKLEDNETIASQINSGNLPEHYKSALTSAINAVYSCNPDDLTDKSPLEWKRFTFAALKNMYGRLIKGVIEKSRASGEIQEKKQGVIAFTRLGSKTTFASAIEKMKAKKNK
ncbi:MAG: hypothetical protein V1734_02955 [Nanoarchaeota archaeon]